MGPSRTVADYEEKAANTAEAMRSVVETALMVSAAAAAGDAPSRYTSLVLSEAEGDAGSIAEGFERVQPPSASVEDLRHDLTTVLDEVTSRLAELRIAAYRGDDAALTAHARKLEPLSRRLADFMRLRPT